MKVVIPGGSGVLGRVVARALAPLGHEIVILSRNGRPEQPAALGAPPAGRIVPWDGRTIGPWSAELDGADMVLNLAGRSVNCRYSKTNVVEMMRSRVDATRVVGQAVTEATRPPRVWLQMSTATIYAHRYDAPNDDVTGRLGGDEPDTPRYWRTSVDIARAWEATLAEAPTPATRKIALRAAMVMTPDPGAVLDVLLGLVRWHLGGAVAGGGQWVSWIHERDFVRALLFLVDRSDLAGPINLTAPNPLPQRELMAALRRAAGVRGGLPATRWMAAMGAFFLRTDPELVLKSRRVAPRRLLDAGFTFEWPSWPAAAEELVARRRASRS